VTATVTRDGAAGLSLATRTSLGLASVATVGAALTLLLPDVLNGTDAMNGSARGTAVLMLVAGIPALLGATFAAPVIGTARASVIWLGVLGYFVYNCLLFLLATPFNELFLVYVAMLTLALTALATLLLRIDPHTVARRLPARTARALSVYLGLVVVANTTIWLKAVVPALADADSPPFLEGTGLTTNPIYVQDLSFWLPLGALVTWWLWHRRPWGVVLGGGFLSMWVLESLSVAVDQWFGSLADPDSTVVSSSMVLPFVLLAVISTIVLAIMLRDLAPASRGGDVHAGDVRA
jgi:hypothetical protein